MLRVSGRVAIGQVDACLEIGQLAGGTGHRGGRKIQASNLERSRAQDEVEVAGVLDGPRAYFSVEAVVRASTDILQATCLSALGC